MRASFNVLTEGWIPVVQQDGERKLLGVVDVLRQAHTLREISDPSPMVEYSLYRFLSVFLMDALRPEDLEDLEDIIADGAFDFGKIEAYITLCQNEGVSFDLFDEARPFLQTPHDDNWDKATKSAAALDYTLPTGNNHTHYEHSGESVSLSFAEAARLLVPVQLFCTAGVQGYPSNVSSSPPYYTLVKGSNLFETLSFSLTAVDRISIPFDAPPVIWRNTGAIEPKRVVAETSWLYGMLFPARRVHLIADNGRVREVTLIQGLNYKGDWDDPHVTYRLMKEGRTPWRPNQEKAIWRNLDDLVDVRGKKAPYVLRQYFELEKETDTASITLYGVQTNQASYLGTFQFDLEIPARLAEDTERVGCLTACIGAAEELAKGLRHSLSGISEIPDTIVAQAVQEYYDCCEQIVWTFCRNYLGEQEADPKEAYTAWSDKIVSFACEVRSNTLTKLRLRAHTMVEAAAKEKELVYSIKKIRQVVANG